MVTLLSECHILKFKIITRRHGSRLQCNSLEHVKGAADLSWVELSLVNRRGRLNILRKIISDNRRG